MLYLYCLVSEACAVPPELLRGVDDAAVRMVQSGSLKAWVSDLRQTPSATTRNAQAHNLVIVEAMRSETPLPARFGQTFSDETAARAAISGHATKLMSALEMVRGGVEMTVRALLAVRNRRMAEPASTGRYYLAQLGERQKLEEEAEEEANFLQRRISAVIAPLVLAEVRGKPLPSSRCVSISHLITTSAVEDYRSRLRLLRDEDSAFELLVSGPWAPYSFAGIPDA